MFAKEYYHLGIKMTLSQVPIDPLSFKITTDY